MADQREDWPGKIGADATGAEAEVQVELEASSASGDASFCIRTAASSLARAWVAEPTIAGPDADQCKTSAETQAEFNRKAVSVAG